MTEPQFSDHDLNELQARNPDFHSKSYAFVCQALESVTRSCVEPRHVTSLELSESVKQRAIDEFGVMARTVLQYWGINSTADVGRIVYAMVEQGILLAGEGDSPDHFDNLFDFQEAFESNYPWAVGV